MKSIKEHIFPDEHLVGILGSPLPKASLVRRFSQALKKEDPQAVCLPLEVDRRFLKNIIPCMRLMDVTGLVIQDSLTKDIFPFLSSRDPIATLSGQVDLIARDTTWKGFAIYGRALLNLLQEQSITLKRKRAVLIGNGDICQQVAAALLVGGIKNLFFSEEKKGLAPLALKRKTSFYKRLQKTTSRQLLNTRSEILILGDNCTTRDKRMLRQILSSPSSFDLIVDVREHRSRVSRTRTTTYIHRQMLSPLFFQIPAKLLVGKTPG